MLPTWCSRLEVLRSTASSAVAHSLHPSTRKLRVLGIPGSRKPCSASHTYCVLSGFVSAAQAS